MTIKLLFAPDDGTLLGAQVVGAEGVDTRIDILAIALQAGMTVFDLEEVELAYCPQYGSAKDAINMAGFVASNVLRGDCPQVYAEDLAATTPAPFLLDVRTPAEFSAGAIPGFVEHPRGGSWWAASATCRRIAGFGHLPGRPARVSRDPPSHSGRARRGQPCRWIRPTALSTGAACGCQSFSQTYPRR